MWTKYDWRGSQPNSPSESSCISGILDDSFLRLDVDGTLVLRFLSECMLLIAPTGISRLRFAVCLRGVGGGEESRGII